MPEQMRPASNQQAPEPSSQFDRSDPKREAGQGRLQTNSKATPTPRPDKMPTSVPHAQDGTKQLNAEDAITAGPTPDEAAMEAEPLGWDKKSKKPKA